MITNIFRAVQMQMPRLAEEAEDERVQHRTISGRVLKKASLFLYAFSMIALIAWEAIQMAAPNGSAGDRVDVALARGKFAVLDFKPTTLPPKAVVLFGSGDGGWSPFEEAICKSLRADGYEAVGIDELQYAKSDYTLPILQGDMSRIAQKFRARYGEDAPPVILGGWSMGAGQAIAAAGGPHPPAGLIGVLLLDPCSRGRYGLRVRDQADILPTGEGTFGVEEFTKTMGHTRVVQWHAAEDSIDSRAWLKDLTAPHREFDFQQTGHYYNHDRDDFLTQLIKSVTWIMGPTDGGGTTVGERG